MISADMNRFKIRQTGGLWIFLMILSAGSLAAFELNITDAVSIAMKNNKTYLSALQEQSKAEGNIREARAGAFPSLSFDGYYIRNFDLQEIVFGDQRIQIGTDNVYQLAFNLRQTLFDFSVYNAVSIAKLYGKYADESVREAGHQVVYYTREYFYAAILARDNVGVFRDAVATAEENFKVVSSQYSQGLVSEYDKLSAEVDLANLRPQLIKSVNTADIALNNLRYFIGYQGQEQIALDFEFNIGDTIPTPDLQQSLQTALANRPDYVGQDFLIKAYQKAIGVARSGSLPSLYFSAALDWSASINKGFPGGDDWIRSSSLSLNLSFPIFDGLETSGRVKKAKAEHIQSTLARQQIEDILRIEVEDAIGSLEESKQRLASGEKTIALAEEGLRVANLRFKNGVGTQLEILSAQGALTQAKTNYIQAIYDYQISLAKYDKAVGMDLPDTRR